MAISLGDRSNRPPIILGSSTIDSMASQLLGFGSVPDVNFSKFLECINKGYPAHAIDDDRKLAMMWMSNPQHHDEEGSRCAEGCEKQQALIGHLYR